MTTRLESAAPVDGRSFDEQLGEAIHQVMWRRKITQTEFAARVLGITQSALSQKLRGKRPFLAGELVAVADELGLDLNQLTPRKNPPPTPTGGGGRGAAAIPFDESPLSGLNRRPLAYKASALPLS